MFSKSVLPLTVISPILPSLTEKIIFIPIFPKGYQISQYKYPLVSGGVLQGVAITRVHLEEDTGTSLHDEGDYSLVNYNRAGVPLMELVTEPVIHSGSVAAAFAKELQLLLRYLAVAEANAWKKARCGLRPISRSVPILQNSAPKLKSRTSTRSKAVEKAIEYEVERHIELLEKARR